MGLFTNALKIISPLVIDAYSGKSTGIFNYDTTVKAHPTLKREDYTQDDSKYTSMKINPDGWEAYNRAVYRNPRLEKDSLGLSIRTSPETSSNSTIKTRQSKNVGTGMAAPASSTNNPFGKLDAGLNI